MGSRICGHLWVPPQGVWESLFPYKVCVSQLPHKVCECHTYSTRYMWVSQFPHKVCVCVCHSSPTRCVWVSQFSHELCVPARVSEGGFTLGKPDRNQVVKPGRLSRRSPVDTLCPGRWQWERKPQPHHKAMSTLSKLRPSPQTENVTVVKSRKCEAPWDGRTQSRQDNTIQFETSQSRPWAGQRTCRGADGAMHWCPLLDLGWQAQVI